MVPRVVVGDIDGDGSKEFVVIEGTSDTIITPRLFSAGGVEKTWGAVPITNFPCQLSLADLDHNGMLETILFTCDGQLHILQPDGTERTGWPKTIPYSFGTVTVGDLDRDGHEEIVVSSGNIYVFNTDGTSFSGAWPKMGNFNPSTEFFYGQAVLADVNGDGYPEIVTTLETNVTNGPPGLQTYLTAQLIALDRFGNTVRSWNLPGSHGEAPGEFIYATVGDFDKDGLTEIAVQYGLPASGTVTTSTMISMFATGVAFNADANDWPMTYRDSRNTSVLRRVAASSVSLTPPAGAVTAGQPATFTVNVAPVAQATGTPTGTANLLDGSQNVGLCQLSSGACTMSVSLAAGSHSLIAGYTGDRNFASSLSASVTYTIAPPSNPTPAISTLSPAFTGAGGASFTLTVSGSGFVSDSVIYWGTTAMATSVASATQLTAQIAAAQIVKAGIAAITVQTPAPGGGTSNSQQFEVDSASGTTSAPKFTTLTATVSPGSAASYPVTLPSSATNVSVTCLNLPAGAACSYSSNPSTVTITTATTTPTGTYKITVVFTETLPGAASALVLVPILLLPLALIRRKLLLRGAWFGGCVVLALTIAGVVSGCGGGGGSSTPNPPTPSPTHTVTSSATITLIVQ